MTNSAQEWNLYIRSGPTRSNTGLTIPPPAAWIVVGIGDSPPSPSLASLPHQTEGEPRAAATGEREARDRFIDTSRESEPRGRCGLPRCALPKSSIPSGGARQYAIPGDGGDRRKSPPLLEKRSYSSPRAPVASACGQAKEGNRHDMQAASPWTMKTLPMLGNHLRDPTRLAGSSSSFHSTPASFAKWRNKWDCHKSEKGARKASRNYERYVVRQKRAEGKKALKDYLLFGKPSPYLQGSTGSFANSHAIPRFKTFRKGPQTHWSSKSRQSVHNHRKNKKDKERFRNFFHEDHYVHPDDIFEAIFGARNGFTWSHISWEGFHFGDKSFRFRWSGGESRRQRIPSDSEDEESEGNESRETTSVGSHAHRVILGLPPCGPLTLEDVKTAFRASALRWHPDRHPGSSQAMAEEKFKLCVNAYNSLCSVLKAA